MEIAIPPIPWQTTISDPCDRPKLNNPFGHRIDLLEGSEETLTPTQHPLSACGRRAKYGKCVHRLVGVVGWFGVLVGWVGVLVGWVGCWSVGSGVGRLVRVLVGGFFEP